jgi:ABC-2 type transport system permease protein
MGKVLIELLNLLVMDAIFVGLCMLTLAPLSKFKRAAFAVLKRNFVGYFSNPTGYVFLCLFVLLTSLAAFWPHEFFTANLANLDQLNAYLPYIMLVFIPAITMSIWSEEKRLGTDELLLTLPADDFDVVIGKYLAAAAIFTSSLLFSQLATYIVLVLLTMGDLDTGLFFVTYLGYWLVGLAMLSVGMVASFFTSNMTVGFILGVAFNAPLAFGDNADVIISNDQLARRVSFWGLAEHFGDFGRGVISISSIGYFLLITVLGLYLCMVLIGARHWSGGRDGDSMLWHYLVRTLALGVGLVGLVLILEQYDRFFRKDLTLGQVSSLSSTSKELIRNLETERPVVIDAFISAQVPERYVQTRFNLVSLLKEFDALSGGKVDVRLHENLEPFSDEAVLAEQRFGIQPTSVRTRTRGAFKDEEVILGAAVTSGLEKVVVPFFDYGIPVEYELIRSIGTVSQGQRKRVGIVRTDAQLYGGFSFAGGIPQQIPKSEIVDELEKQYEVEEVDPTSPIDTVKYDVLIAVQPSSLTPEELTNLVAAIRAGKPTAIFEDPQPSLGEFARVPATGDPKQAPGGNMFGGGAPLPKGDLRQLWTAIGIEMPGEPNFQGGVNPDLAWQEYLPYLKLQIQGIPDQWVFASNDAPGANGEALNPENPITAGLGEILLPLPGVIEPSSSSDLKFTPLVQTSTAAGRIRLEDFRNNQQEPMRLKAIQGRARGVQVLAARIQGVPSGGSTADANPPAQDPAAAGAAEPPAQPASGPPIDVVYVADIDLMISAFLRIRARPEDDEEIDWRFENVNFLLNIVDVLSGNDQYLEIRGRKPHHSTLKVVEERAQQRRDEEFEERVAFEEKFKSTIAQIEQENQRNLKKFQDRVDELNTKRQAGENVSLAELTEAAQQLEIQRSRLTQKLEVSREQLQRERDDSIESIQRQTDLEIDKIQSRIKALAVALPPIPPALVGLVVFVRRRLREREGVSKTRLK